MAKLGLPVIQSTAAYAVQLATSLGLVIVVSRLLSPAEIGAYLIAAAIMILVMPLRDFQIQSYVLQRSAIETESLRPVSFVAWASAGVSILVCLIAAVTFGMAYPQEPIAICILIMAISLAVRPLGLLPMALLARELRYGSIALIQTAGGIVKIVVTLGLIEQGFGAEALAWGYVAELAVESCAIVLVPKGQRIVRPSVAGSKEVFRFAAPFTGANLVLTISLAAIPVIIGGYLGLAVAAFFNRARTITQFFRSSVEGAVHQIVLQRFAQKRDDHNALRADYIRSIALLTATSWPALVWLHFLAVPLTLLLFGSEWIGAALLMQGLAVAGFIYSASAFSRQLHAAMDDTALLFRRDAWLQVPLLASVLVAAQFSAQAVVAAIAAVSLLAFAVHMWLLNRRLRVRPTALAAALWPSFVLALAVGASVVGAVKLLNPMTTSGFVFIPVAAGLAAAAWATALILVRHPLLAEIRGFLSDLRDGPKPELSD